MYLRRLELSGFKTFADKTTLEFGPGITAVVGPNGVGKSNVADAVMWALGEQSMRALRSTTTRDVIFAGSSGRSPLGLAEVSLTLDNSDGALPIEFTEVAVSRRIYRSGDTEYLINRSRSRRRDIHELFMGTGIGAGAHAIVTQGEIDSILSLRSEDRRELLEAVAGVSKYRSRREEALKKLDATLANITRINDIVHELEQQRGPLHKQAEVALEYKGLHEELLRLELQVLVSSHRRSRERLGRLEHEMEVTRRNAAAAAAALEDARRRAEAVREQADEQEGELAAVRDEAAAALRAADQAEAAQHLAQERLSSLEGRREAWRGTWRAATERAEAARARAEAARTELADAEQRLAQTTAAVAAAETALTAARAAHQEHGERLAGLREQHGALLSDRGRLANEAVMLESLEADLNERRLRLERQRGAVQERADTGRQAGARAAAELNRLATKVAELERRTATEREDLTRVRQALRDHRAKCSILEAAKARAESRQTVLEEMRRSHEGCAEGIRAVLAAQEQGQLEGVRGTVGDVLNVPAKAERAIEAALGERLLWVLTNTQDDARRAVAFLREHQQGRSTFLPLQSLANLPVASALAYTGSDCMGLASKIVKVRGEFQKAIDYLLADTYIVTDLEAALALNRRLSFQARCVSLAGEVVEKCGAITGGAIAGEHPAFQRQRELEAAAHEAQELTAALRAMLETEDKLQVAAERFAARARAADEKLAGARTALAEARNDTVHRADQQQTAEQAITEFDAELDALGAKVADTTERLLRCREQAERLQQEAAELDGPLAELAAQPPDARPPEEVAAEATALQVAEAELREKSRALQAEVGSHEATAVDATREAEAAQEALADLDREEEALRSGSAAQVEVAAARAVEAEKLREAVLQRTETHQALRAQLDALAEHERGLGTAATQHQEEAHRLEMAGAREQAELGHIAERLQDQYELTPEQAYARAPEEPDNLSQAAEHVQRLRRRIRALGPVNTGAAEEYERLLAREEYLSTQKTDLEQSRGDLLQIIAEIDEETRSAFMDAFHQVGVEFDQVFKRLFGGGETRLTLTDPDNLLETGVDVTVKLPGKRQQNLLLLSGGERAMTAAALLLALLRVRPSPFCIMDEIDAPLDEENTTRFVRVLQDFAHTSQIIIVTHNPRTIEAASRIWGITMADPGVSMVVRMELEDAVREAEAWQAKRPGGKKGVPEGQATLDLALDPA